MERLQRSRLVMFGSLPAVVEYGEERKIARITVTTYAYSAEMRRCFRRAVERLGIATTTVDSVGDKDGTKRPRLVAYSCVGEQAQLELLIALPCVESWGQCSASVPHKGPGAGEEKHVVRDERLAVVRKNGMPALI